MTSIFSHTVCKPALSMLLACLFCVACTNMDYQVGGNNDADAGITGTTLLVNDGVPFVYSVGVTLTHDVQGADLMRFSNDGTTWSQWTECQTPYAWLLHPENGQHTVYAQFCNGEGEQLELSAENRYVCRVTAGDGDAGDRFGRDVAMSADGSTVIVGVEDDNGREVYVYARLDSGIWQEAVIEETSVVSGDRYGFSVALSGDGTIAAVGAPHADTGAGKVFLYTGDANGGWTLMQAVTPDVPDTSAGFGYSLALSDDGSILAAGAPGETVGTDLRRGSVYVFRRQGSPAMYVQLQRMIDTAGAEFDQMGYSVDISGNGSVLGSGVIWAQVGQNIRQGKALLFNWNNGTQAYTENCTLTAPGGDGLMNDHFGYDLAISRDGSRVAVGVPHHDLVVHDDDRGAVYTFYKEQATNAYQYEEKLTATQGSSKDQFGGSVALNGDGSILAVGTRFHNGNGISERGGVYTFRYADNTWSFPNLLTVPDAREEDRLGVAIDCDDTGARVAVGASRDDIKTTDDNRGSVYILGTP